MPLFTRRRFLTTGALAAAGMTGVGGWAFALEPGFMLELRSYALTPANWPPGLRLRMAVLADLHVGEPWMSAARVRRICELANALEPDVIVLLGDYQAGTKLVTAPVQPEAWGEAMSVLKAPLGVYGVLGNHDVWHGILPNVPGDDGATVARTLTQAGVRVLDNDLVRITKDGHGFWILGLADQMHEWISRGVWRGRDDLDGTLARVTDDAPAILLAHEPFIFRRVPTRVSLTLCGHTHGGQVMLPFIGNPLLRRRIPQGHEYGLVQEEGRNMIVTAGLGVSIIPARFMRPPEIVEVTLSA